MDKHRTHLRSTFSVKNSSVTLVKVCENILYESVRSMLVNEGGMNVALRGKKAYIIFTDPHADLLSLFFSIYSFDIPEY